MDQGLTSRKRAIKMLNTGLTDEEIEELLEEIDEETPVIAAPAALPTDNGDEENAEP